MICRECGKDKERSFFDKNRRKCKSCVYLQQKNSPNRKAIKRKHYENNKDSIKAKDKEYKIRNRCKIQAYQNNRRKTDPIYRLSCNRRIALAHAIKKRGYTKRSDNYKILGCTWAVFKEHLEALFEPWMSWDNYGLYNGTPNYGWDVDHIIPQSSAINEEVLLSLNHYTNLKPLCSYINRDIKKDLN